MKCPAAGTAPKRGTGFDDALLRARAQAEGYARALPADEGRPPFLIVVDVGHVIELYADFTRSGATYTPFPDPRSHRIRLNELVDESVRQRLAAVWAGPNADGHPLDPTRASAKVTREIAAHLAELAKSLEAAHHAPEAVAGFLTRCLFSMFAEDVHLIPKGSFTALLQDLRDDPAQFVPLIHALWKEMDIGGFSAVLRKTLPRFNGKLFKEPTVLPLSKTQIDLLIEASKADWTQVEPAIFGTLLERALDPAERHSLGAHYTPRAYVERLVMPTVIEPLRAHWANVQAAAVLLANEGKEKEAVTELRAYLHRLCHLRVLDPACGSGNFLYVTLEHMKRLEGEVLNQLADLGAGQAGLEMEGAAVDPHQFLGLEINPRAAAIAELVLWIGYLQWHFRTRGSGAPPSPVLKDFRNIECRDAVLAYDRVEFVTDERGVPVTRWDGRTMKTHPVTGEAVPDERAQVPLEKYVNPRKADWPAADVVVGNPPFIGKLRMRAALGDGYVDALRSVWTNVPESADFVMFWWHHAACLVLHGELSRFGLITTNSITQTFNRRVVQTALDIGTGQSTVGAVPFTQAKAAASSSALQPVHLAFAVPDHPWVDSADGAAVRIAMTVLGLGTGEGQRFTVVAEREGEEEGIAVALEKQTGVIHADLSIGANVNETISLRANSRLSTTGVIPHGAGMVVTQSEAAALDPGAPIKPYRNGKDITDRSRGVLVIDCHGLTQEQVRQQFPLLYQWLLNRVKPERDANRDKDLKEKWWLHRRNNDDMRRSLSGLTRYIATCMTAKHRVFLFLDGSILPDQMLVVIALDDAELLGVLSSRAHVVWALALGSRLGVGNDPRYNKSRCFETFPFPAEHRPRIAELAEEIDAHRKRVLAAHDELTLTGLYNVLTQVGAGETALNPKQKRAYELGLVGVLAQLHAELDAEVYRAYGWADTPSDEQILDRLVALNLERAREEAAGHIRWLRPEFQNPNPAQAIIAGVGVPRATICDKHEESGAPSRPAAPPVASKQNWPTTLPEQMQVLAASLGPQAQSLDDIAARFSGKGKWKARLPDLLATLAALGRAREVEPGRWTL